MFDVVDLALAELRPALHLLLIYMRKGETERALFSHQSHFCLVHHSGCGYSTVILK